MKFNRKYTDAAEVNLLAGLDARRKGIYLAERGVLMVKSRIELPRLLGVPAWEKKPGIMKGGGT